MNNNLSNLWRTALTIFLGSAIGVLLILCFTSENPVKVFTALIRGSLIGKLNIGSTLTTYTTLLMTSLGFAMAWNSGFFNVGIEGDLCIGALCCTFVGVYFKDLPDAILLPLCLVASIFGGMLWAYLPAFANIKWNVNLICSGSMMNTAAMYISQYFISGILSDGSTNPQSKQVGARLASIFKPSKLSSGFFIAIAVTVLIIWVFKRTTFGLKLKMVGQNRQHAAYVGINTDRFGLKMMLLSGAMGGLGGFIEIVGNYGYFLNNFFVGLGSKGLLAAMIVKCNVSAIPFSAFFISMLSSGALHMQQTTSVSKAFADTLCAIFIVLASMDKLFARKSESKINLPRKKGGKV